MKITKQQLRQIIRKETSKLNESAGAMPLIGIGALGGSPMSSRPAASDSRRAISEAPDRHLAAVDAAMEAVYTAMESASASGFYDRLGQIYGELEKYREDAVDFLAAMGR